MASGEHLPYKRGSRGKCPHCGCTVFFAIASPVTYAVPGGGQAQYPLYLFTESGGDRVNVFSSQCPNCEKPIILAEILNQVEETADYRLVYPFNVVRTVPPEVPEEIQKDFLEAASVLSTSEKASAALSRRCLQNLLTERGYKGKDLSKQIDAALKDLPTTIAANLDAIRNIGNFATHPMKFKSTGLIVDVEPEEAEWNLDVLEQLFDFYYVQPKKAKEKREKLNEKLKGLGKLPLKKP